MSGSEPTEVHACLVRIRELSDRIGNNEVINTSEHAHIHKELTELKKMFTDYVVSRQSLDVEQYNNVVLMIDRYLKNEFKSVNKRIVNNEHVLYGNDREGLVSQVSSVTKAVRDLKWTVGLVGGGILTMTGGLILAVVTL